ncbi:MAG: hypothetical protein WD884_03955 [Nitrosopumilaceae archaeon]
MRKLLTIVIISGMLLSMSQAFAQEITLGAIPEQTVKITIDEEGIAHVVHEVKGSTKTLQIDAYEGNMGNLSVTDRDGNEVQYLTLEKYPIAIVLPPSGNDMIFIKYDLTDVLSLKDGVWTWEFNAATITNMYFPKAVDMIWVNDRAVYIGEKGIRHHGGHMTLEYVIDEPVVLKQVEWEDKKFTVAIRTLTNVDQFEFNQPTKSITFDVTKGNPLVTVIVPLDLLWEPYEVYLNSNKTLNREFYNNGTHVWLGFRPDTSGTIRIVGTTVVPEFPLFVPLAIGISAVLVLQFRNKFNFR